MSNQAITVQGQEGELLSYLEKWDVSEAMEEMLTEIVRMKPSDPYPAMGDWIFKNKASKTVTIDKLVGREVFDSRGHPAIEVDCYCMVYGVSKMVGRACAPSPAFHTPNELRDNDEERFGGNGCLGVSENVGTMLSEVVSGSKPLEQQSIDDAMINADGTDNKEKVGVGAMVAASMAVANAAAIVRDLQLFEHLGQVYHGEIPSRFSLPIPVLTLMNGGFLAGAQLKFQEFLVIPGQGMSFRDGIRLCTEVYQKLGKLVCEKFGAATRFTSEDGAFAPPVNTCDEAMTLVNGAIQAANLEAGKDVFIGINCGANELLRDGGSYELNPNQVIAPADAVEFYANLIANNPGLVYLEDVFGAEDHEAWQGLRERVGNDVLLVGGALFQTKPAATRTGISEGLANAIVVKQNEVGTLTEAMSAARHVADNGGQVIVGCEVGESTDGFNADLAVAIGAGYLRVGGPHRGEHIAKINRALRIEDHLNSGDK